MSVWVCVWNRPEEKETLIHSSPAQHTHTYKKKYTCIDCPPLPPSFLHSQTCKCLYWRRRSVPSPDEQIPEWYKRKPKQNEKKTQRRRRTTTKRKVGGGLGKAGQDRKVAVVTCTLNLTHLSPADGPSLRLCVCVCVMTALCVCVSQQRCIHTDTVETGRRTDVSEHFSCFVFVFRSFWVFLTFNDLFLFGACAGWGEWERERTKKGSEMRVVTSLEFGGARILQEFWMTLLKVLSRNKKKEPNEQGRQSRTANNKRDHLLMKKHLRHKRFQPFLPVRSPCLLSHSLLIFLFFFFFLN